MVVFGLFLKKGPYRVKGLFSLIHCPISKHYPLWQAAAWAAAVCHSWQNIHQQDTGRPNQGYTYIYFNKPICIY